MTWIIGSLPVEWAQTGSLQLSDLGYQEQLADTAKQEAYFVCRYQPQIIQAIQEHLSDIQRCIARRWRGIMPLCKQIEEDFRRFR